MKKFIFTAMAIMLTGMVMSCDSKSATGSSENDSTAVDTVLVDSAVADTFVVDSAVVSE